MNFYIDKAILERAPRTRLGVFELEGCRVGFGHASLDDMRVRVVNRVRDDVGTAGALSNVPQIAGVDRLITLCSGDPRRSRTQLESILKKVLEGGPMPVENDALDCALLLSMYYKLPIFLADTATLRGNVGLVVGKKGRELEPDRMDGLVRAEGKIVLGDELGYFDSLFTRGKRALVTERTTDMLVVMLFPENVGDSIVHDFLRRGRNWFTTLCKGEVAREGMVGEAEREGRG